MESSVIKCGQTEIATISHDGREFTNLGASISGTHVTGYLKKAKYGPWQLTGWSGKVMLECRAMVAQTYHLEFDETEAVVFSLTNGRFIAGYSLGDGMLFRGELCDDKRSFPELVDALRYAKEVARSYIEIDEEDNERFQWELRQEEDDIEEADEFGDD